MITVSVEDCWDLNYQLDAIVCRLYIQVDVRRTWGRRWLWITTASWRVIVQLPNHLPVLTVNIAIIIHLETILERLESWPCVVFGYMACDFSFLVKDLTTLGHGPPYHRRQIPFYTTQHSAVPVQDISKLINIFPYEALRQRLGALS